jgi:GcrA cell cycle regulator
MHWDVASAAKMWADGVPAGKIAEEFCLDRQYLYNYADKHRDDFPVRQKKERKPVYHYVGTKTPSQPRVRPERLPKPLPELPADRVRRITHSGAVVTMPRIPTIDGYAPQ